MRLRELDDVLITYDFDVCNGERTKVFDCGDAAVDNHDRAISNLMWEYGRCEVEMVALRGEWSGGGPRYHNASPLPVLQ